MAQPVVSSRVVRRVVVTKASRSFITTENGNRKDSVAIPSWLGNLLKIFLVEIPLVILFLSFLGTSALIYLNYTVWFPLMRANEWTPGRAESELTYYDMNCHASSIVTTTNRTDLIISSSMSVQERVDRVRLHGAGYVSDLLREHAADMRRFRIFSIRKNRQIGNNVEGGGVDVVGVIENEHRWSFSFGAQEDPSIAPLLVAIGENTVLQEMLEGLLGPDPAIVELSTITAEEGAKDQGWHFDTAQDGDSLKFSNTFSDLYSLLIPMQDTTTAMGATAICPGTHYCSHMTGCDQHKVQPVDDDGIWKAGDGLLFNSHLGHRGSAHMKGPTRVALVISFVSRPEYNKLLPLAAGYVVPWNSMGFTFQDLRQASRVMVPPWSTFRSLGLTNTNNAGWDYFRFCLSHMGNHRHPPQVIVMPYVKLLPLFLLGQANRHENYSPWQVFVVETLTRVCFLLAVVYGASLYGYLLLHRHSTSKPDGPSFGRANNVVVVLVRLALLHGLVTAVVLRGVTHYQRQYSYSGNVSVKPSVGVSHGAQLSNTYIQGLACPQVHDTLIGPNFLASVSKFAPGNKRWYQAAAAMLPWYLAYQDLPCAFSHAVLDMITFDPIHTADEGQHRVLTQNEHADWIELDAKDAREETRRWLYRLYIPPNRPCTSRRLVGSGLCRGQSYDEYFGPKERCYTKAVQTVKQDTALDSPAQSFESGEIVEVRIRATSRKWTRATVIEQIDDQSYRVQLLLETPEYSPSDQTLEVNLIRKIIQQKVEFGSSGRKAWKIHTASSRWRK